MAELAARVGCGYVTRFAVQKRSLSRYPEQQAGGTVHWKVWIPAEDLVEMKRNIVGQIEVIAEYKVEAQFEAVNVATARWVECDDDKMLEEFRRKAQDNLAIDGAGNLTYIAPTRVNLDLAIERFPEIEFHATREH